MSGYANLKPLIARAMALAGCQLVITDMRDMIALKTITDQLPTIAELKVMPELLCVLLDANR